MKNTKSLTSSMTILTLACGLAVACSEATTTDDGDGGAPSGGNTAETGGTSSGGKASGGASGGASTGGSSSGGSTAGGAPATGGDLAGGGTGSVPPFGYGGLPFGGAPPVGEQECPADKPEAGASCTPGFPTLSCPFGDEVCECAFDITQGPSATGTWECGAPEPLADCGEDVSGMDCTFGDECAFDGLTCVCTPELGDSGPVFTYVCS